MERKPDFPKDKVMETSIDFSEKGKKDEVFLPLKTRQSIRIFHKRIREEMSEEEVREKSRRICERIKNSDWYEASSVIYGYYPLGHEVDCLPVLVQALEEGKRVALPRTDSITTSMEFYEITSLEQVKEGNFHVMEPTTECPQIQPTTWLQAQSQIIMLVPGVVFDVHGNRYGYGKGYYDRYLARFSGFVKAVALAYENQMEQYLDMLETDIPMEYIYTESGQYGGMLKG